MPELPEVQTTVDGLNKYVKNQKIISVWTDLAKNSPIKQFVGTIKDILFFKRFKKLIKNQKILKSERRAKNILIHLSNNYTILIHMKMTGHILYGKYDFDKKNNKWVPSKNEKNKLLSDPYNRFIHVVFSLDNGKNFVFCDSRKFGKVTLIKTDELYKSIHLKNLGPEPLDNNFKLEDFKSCLRKKPNGKIKTVLLDPSIISGIGNIYSDEILWESSINPLRRVSSLKDSDLNKMFKSMKKLLQRGIDLGGDSMSDYRNIIGGRGDFQNKHNTYRLTGDPCKKTNCKGSIVRLSIGARSSHFCDIHQK